MKLSLLVFLAMAFFSLTGCTMLGITGPDNLTIEQKVDLVKGASTAATFAALTEISGDDEEELLERATRLSETIENDVLPLLQDGSATFDEITINLLESKIDPLYLTYLESALSVLKAYVNVPEVGDLMSPEDLALWTALFEGINQGCKRSLLILESQ